MCKVRFVRAWSLAAALGVMLAGCGENPVETCPAGKVGSPPNCTCPTGQVDRGGTCVTDCTTTNVLQDSGGIPAQAVVFDDFSVPDSGRLDVTLDWTVASSQVGFYLVPANTCNTVQEFNNRTCNFLVRSEPSSTKPRKISTANFSAGNYRYLIANYSTAQESASLQIVLQKGTGCSPLTGANVSASSLTQPEAGAVETMLRLH